MIDKLIGFWQRFWAGFKETFSIEAKQPRKTAVQGWRNIHNINLLDVFVTKLDNLTNYEATFEVVSDSELVEPLKALCKNIEASRSEIVSSMLADGDYYIFPSTDSKGNIYHSFLTQGQVRLLEVDGNNITDAFGIIDCYTTEKNKTYYLLRRHTLKNTDLYISYTVLNDEMEVAHVPKWEHLVGIEYVVKEARHIGFGRYKSPQKSRGLSRVYGVPLNFGCEEIERSIMNDFKQEADEFNNGKSVIFTDPRNVIKKSEMYRKGYQIVDNVIPVEKRAGDSGSQIEVFNPTLRFNEFSGKLEQDFEIMEKQIGVSKGILSKPTVTSNATATEVRHNNSDTLALIDKIRVAVDNGNRMTLEADAIFLNLNSDLWTYHSDWYDPYENPAEQWTRLLQAKEAGAIGAEELVKWLFPSMSEEEIKEKIDSVQAQASASIDEAINKALNL